MIVKKLAHLISQTIGYLKGKSAIHIARTYIGRKKNFTDQHVGDRGYFVSTVDADEKTVRDYIRRQETEDRRLEKKLQRPEQLQQAIPAFIGFAGDSCLNRLLEKS
jgi:hypothetical protein